MSDDTSTKTAPAKTTAAKTETAKTETATAKSDSSSAAGSSTSTSTGGADSSATSAPAEKATSGKAAMGGAGEVHYGFFSNIKTPQYRSGWDSIWSKGKTTETVEVKKKRPPRSKEPVTVSLSMEDLPDELRDALTEIVRARLKGSRISYDRREKVGAVRWTIDCEIRR
jgi:hypothetical protein